MRMTVACVQSQALMLEGALALEELYLRLSRWTIEAIESHDTGDWHTSEARIAKAIALLGFMDRTIDVSSDYEIATSILSLHRFAIGALIRARVERSTAALDGLPSVFVSLAEVFALMAARIETSGPGALVTGSN